MFKSSSSFNPLLASLIAALACHDAYRKLLEGPRTGGFVADALVAGGAEGARGLQHIISMCAATAEVADGNLNPSVT